MCYNYETLIYQGLRRQIHIIGKEAVLAGLSIEEKRIWEEQQVNSPDHLLTSNVYEEAEKKSIFPGNEATVVPLSTNKLELYYYGFIPDWATSFNDKRKNFNCRSDAIRIKPTWKKAWLNKQRCLVVATGFFETNKETKKRYFFSVKDNEEIFFAGIYNHWKDEQDKHYKSFAIITHEPNELVNNVHNRMPVILNRAGAITWLNLQATEEAVFNLLQSYPAALMEMREAPAPPRIKNTGPELSLGF